MSYEDPFKIRALKALTDALEEITPDNDYVSDLTDSVFRGRLWFGDTDPLPMVSIIEGTHPADDVAEPSFVKPVGEYDWDLLVQGFVDDDPLNPTDPAYVLMADVRRRLAALATRKAAGTNTLDPLGLGLTDRNKIIALRIGPGVVRPADDVSAKAFFWLTLTLRVIDSAAHPYD